MDLSISTRDFSEKLSIDKRNNALTLVAQADTVSTGIVSVGNGKRILIESLSGSAPGLTGANLVGGAEGSQFKCYYTEANKVVLDAFSRISNTAENAALTSSFTSSTGL